MSNSKITNDALTRFGTGSFIAVPIIMLKLSKLLNRTLLRPALDELNIIEPSLEILSALAIAWTALYQRAPGQHQVGVLYIGHMIPACIISKEVDYIQQLWFSLIQTTHEHLS